MKRAKTLLAALALLALGALAGAEVITDGTVEYGQTVTQRSSMGGSVSQVYVQENAYVHAGDPVAAIGLERVYAPCAGTVEAILAGEGESAADAVEKYGSALTLLPENLYTVYVTSENAYSSVRTGLISPGEEVYLKCTRDGTHRGTGRITEIDGEIYYVETTGGAFYNGETVYVYMEPDYDTEDRIGKGTIVAVSAQGVSADGDVVKLYVDVGDFVEKGQLLMETVGALPDEGGIGETQLTAQTEGYVVSVYAEANAELSKEDLLLEICPPENLVVKALVGEDDVTSIAVGDTATITIELAEETLRTRGVVNAVSYVPQTTDEGETVYAALLAMEPDARIAPGMSATVTLGIQ